MSPETPFASQRLEGISLNIAGVLKRAEHREAHGVDRRSDGDVFVQDLRNWNIGSAFRQPIVHGLEDRQIDLLRFARIDFSTANGICRIENLAIYDNKGVFQETFDLDICIGDIVLVLSLDTRL